MTAAVQEREPDTREDGDTTHDFGDGEPWGSADGSHVIRRCRRSGCSAYRLEPASGS